MLRPGTPPAEHFTNFDYVSLTPIDVSRGQIEITLVPNTAVRVPLPRLPWAATCLF